MFKLLAALAFLVPLISSTPTPADLTPRTCAGLGPATIDVLWRTSPNWPYTGQEFVLSRGYGVNMIVSLLTFDYIPQDATGCMLQITIPALDTPNEIARGSSIQADIWTTDPWWPNNPPTWNTQPAKREMVATFRFPTYTTESVFQTILASNVCSHPMTFLVELSDWQTGGTGNVDFFNTLGEKENIEPLGFEMIYNC